MMEAELRALLTGHGALTALVPAARIVWNHLPQGTQRPAIVLYRISGGPGIHMQGSDGLINARVQIDVQATSVSSMWAIRDALVSLLHGHRGNDFQAISLLSERQDSDQAAGGGGLIHRSSLDFDVWAASA